MRLIDLDPRWVGSGGAGVSMPGPDSCLLCDGTGCDVCHKTGKQYIPAPERHGIGLSFLCPCAECTVQRKGNSDEDFHLRVFVSMANPIDGGPLLEPGRPIWSRTGDTFETLSLQPSILSDKAKGGCGWHGYITNGEVTNA